jgi:RecB family exonuclease
MTSSHVPMQLSPTSIDRWRVCPRRFLYQDVQRLPVDDAKTFEQILGEVVHKVLETLFRLKPAKRDHDAIARLVDLAVLRFSTRGALAEGDRERLREEALHLVERFIESSGVDARVRPLKIEQAFQLRLKNKTTILTRVDRIDRAQSGLLEIIDYKTGRNQLDVRDLGYETAPIVQLHAVGKASDIPVEKVTWVYLRTGEHVVWWPEIEDVDTATDRLITVLQKIHQDEEFEPNVGAHCAYCPFSPICPARSEGAAETPIEKAA